MSLRIHFGPGFSARPWQKDTPRGDFGRTPSIVQAPDQPSRSAQGFHLGCRSSRPSRRCWDEPTVRGSPATQGSSRARPSTSAPKKAFEEQECGDLALSDVRQPVEGKLLFIEGVRGPGAVWTLEFRRNGPVSVQPAGGASAGPGLIVVGPREITLGS
jgi:hypothetical protein